jgi:hypothetical protein
LKADGGHAALLRELPLDGLLVRDETREVELQLKRGTLGSLPPSWRSDDRVQTASKQLVQMTVDQVVGHMSRIGYDCDSYRRIIVLHHQCIVGHWLPCQCLMLSTYSYVHLISLSLPRCLRSGEENSGFFSRIKTSSYCNVTHPKEAKFPS